MRRPGIPKPREHRRGKRRSAKGFKRRQENKKAEKRSAASGAKWFHSEDTDTEDDEAKSQSVPSVRREPSSDEGGAVGSESIPAVRRELMTESVVMLKRSEHSRRNKDTTKCSEHSYRGRDRASRRRERENPPTAARAKEMLKKSKIDRNCKKI